MPITNEFIDICKRIDDELDKSELPNPHIQQTKIGHHITTSAVLYGEVILNEDSQPEKIVRCYSINRHVSFIAYETIEAIYVIVGPYYAYWGYYDKNMDFHSLADTSEHVFGIPLDFCVIKEDLKKLRRRYKRIEFFFWFKKFLRKKILIFNVMNLGHHIWNEQAGLDFFADLNLLNKIDKAGFYVDFFKTSKWLKDNYHIRPYHYRKRKFVTNDILVSFSVQTYYNNTSERLLKYCIDNSNDSFVNNNQYVIIICLRWNQRVWLEEDKSIPELLNDILMEYNNVQFIIDGYSAPAAGKLSTDDINNIKSDFEHLKKIHNNMTENVKRKTKNIIGFNCVDKVNIYNKANLLVMPYGTPEHYNWIVKKSIITYGPKAARKLSTDLHSPQILSGVKIDNTAVPESNIKQKEGTLNYSMDYRILKNLILKKLDAFYKGNNQ